MRGIGRVIFWDYARGSWQYDVMVGLILLFIFLTPREIFNDQPKAANVVMLRGGFWIDPQLLNGVPETNWFQSAAAVVNQRFTYAAGHHRGGTDPRRCRTDQRLYGLHQTVKSLLICAVLAVGCAGGIAGRDFLAHG